MRTSSRLLATRIVKSYDETTALSGIDLDLSPGEILALLGPNGAGKSTLVSILAGLRKPDSGELQIDGIDALRYGLKARARLGFVSQGLGIYPTISTEDNLGFFGELGGLRGSRLKKRIRVVAEALDLEQVLTRSAQSLSGGEARRLHIGMALMNTPSLLLLDEPTAGVDLHLRDNLLSLIRELADEGTSILYCTHFLPEVEKLRSSVAILVNGRIVARGSVADLLRKFTNSTLELHFDGPPPEVARPDVRVTGSTLRVVTSSSAAGEAAALLSELGEDNRRLRGINLVEAGLEAAYVEALSNSKRGAGPGCDSVE